MTALTPEENKKKQCPEFPHFGARYPDARCIDGYLWDLDKYEDGMLYGGGEDPCPFCNTEEYVEQNVDEWEWEEGDPQPITREILLKHIEYLKQKHCFKSEQGNKEVINPEEQQQSK